MLHSSLLKACPNGKCSATKHHQTLFADQTWPNGKKFGHQTMFDGVWSPNIYIIRSASSRVDIRYYVQHMGCDGII